MGARQDANLYVDRAYGPCVATIDARLASDYPVTHDPFLEFRQRAVDTFGAPARIFTCSERFDSGRLGVADGRLAFDLVGYAVCVRETRRSAAAAAAAVRSLSSAGACHSHARLANLGSELVDGVDRHLHLLVAEHDRAEHHVFREHLRLGLDHQNRVSSSGDDEVETGLCECRNARVKKVVAILVANPGCADRALERQCRKLPVRRTRRSTPGYRGQRPGSVTQRSP